MGVKSNLSFTFFRDFGLTVSVKMLSSGALSFEMDRFSIKLMVCYLTSL
jgi:hypothetical protein